MLSIHSTLRKLVVRILLLLRPQGGAEVIVAVLIRTMAMLLLPMIQIPHAIEKGVIAKKGGEIETGIEIEIEIEGIETGTAEIGIETVIEIVTETAIETETGIGIVTATAGEMTIATEALVEIEITGITETMTGTEITMMMNALITSLNPQTTQ